MTGDTVNQTLRIAGNQNVHRRRGRQHKFPVPIVASGPEEIIQHLIVIGGTNQLLKGHTHLLCVICRQNIAEVAGGNHHVDLLILFNLAICI